MGYSPWGCKQLDTTDPVMLPLRHIFHTLTRAHDVFQPAGPERLPGPSTCPPSKEDAVFPEGRGLALPKGVGGISWTTYPNNIRF